MRTWTVVYQGTQREEVIEEGSFGSETLANFDRAAKDGNINGRAITGMWIIDCSAAEDRVLRIYGRVGSDIHSRHAASASM
jgi:hypothetical protein